MASKQVSTPVPDNIRNLIDNFTAHVANLETEAETFDADRLAKLSRILGNVKAIETLAEQVGMGSQVDVAMDYLTELFMAERYGAGVDNTANDLKVKVEHLLAAADVLGLDDDTQKAMDRLIDRYNVVTDAINTKVDAASKVGVRGRASQDPGNVVRLTRNVDHTPTSCTVCGEVFDGPAGMKRHRTRTHGKSVSEPVGNTSSSQAS